MIQRTFKFFTLAIIGLILSCDSTGICVDPTTPKLMVGFSGYDLANNETAISPPKGTAIFGLKDGKKMNAYDLINNESKDSSIIYPLYPSVEVANSKKLIPLYFDENRDETQYIYEFLNETEDAYIADTIKISYKREQYFVSSECGYKTIFKEVNLDYYTTNKVETVSLLDDFIEYDSNQHIKIFLKE